MNPLVSIILPVYNAEKHVGDAVKSMLAQTLSEFEIIILDDGSSDNSCAVIESFIDRRIVFIKNESNIGLVKTLNKGLGLVRGEFIARMDADDVSMPQRLQKQYDFLQSNPDVGVCGTFYIGLGKMKRAVFDFPSRDEDMRPFMLFNSPIAHPTAMIRKKILMDNNLSYSEKFIHAEDFALWTQISTKAALANIPECLLQYRMHEFQVSTQADNQGTKAGSVSELRKLHLAKLSLSLTDFEFGIHTRISEGVIMDNDAMMNDASNLLSLIRDANREKKVFNPSSLDRVIIERWLRTCINYYGIKKGIRMFLSSKLFRSINSKYGKLFGLRKNIYHAWKRSQLKSSK